ncbi:MAG: PAS domain S-box protein [Ginsengibacter sp.]
MNRKPASFISLVATIITMIIGILGIIGYFTYNDFLRSIVPGGVKMVFNVAWGLICSSIVLLLFLFPLKNKIWRTVSGFLSVTVCLIGLLTIAEYIFHIDLGIDDFFFRDKFSIIQTYHAGRMSPISAVNFVLIGIGLLLLKKEKAAVFHFFYLVPIALVALLMLINFNFISDIPLYIKLAIHVAFGFITLSAAIYLAQPAIQKKINFQTKLVTGFLAAITLLVIISISSSYYNARRVYTSHLVEHTNKVLDEAAATLSLIKDIESGGRAFVITNDSSYLAYFIVAKHTISDHVKNLKALTTENSSQQERIDSLRVLVAKRIAISEEAIHLRNEKGLNAGIRWIATSQGKYYTDRIRYFTQEIQNEEKNLLTGREQKNEKSISAFNRTFYTLLATMGALLVFLFFIIKYNLKKRIKAEEKIRELNASLEHRVIERTEELHESEKKYRYLFENNPMPMWIIDLNTFQFLNVNNAAVIHYGYGKEEFLSMTALDIRPETERQRFIQLERSAFATVRNRGDWKHLKKDGSIIDVEIITYEILYEGKKARFILSNDITEKVKAEEKLLQEKYLLRTLIDILPDYIYFKDTQSRHLVNNKANIELMGASNEEETIGKSVIDFFGAEIAKSFIENDQLIIKTGATVTNMEEIIDRSTGKIKYLLTTKVAVKDKNGKVTGLVGISRDITKQKEIQLELQNSKYFLEKAQKVGQIGHWISDRKRGKLTWSEEVCYIFGINYGDFDEKIETFLNRVHPDDLEKVKSATALAIENNQPYSIDHRIVLSSGTIKWVNEQGETIFDGNGKAVMLMGIVQDITERKSVEEKIKQSEKIYKTIASHIPGSLICLFDPDYRYLLIEGDMLEKLGYSKEALLGSKAPDVMSPERYALLLPDLIRVFTGEIFTTESISGGYDVVTRFVPLKDENNVVYGAMTVAIDVTQLQNAQRKIFELNIDLERKVIERTMQLEEANKELEAFTYSVSHDLRAPLRIIDGFAGIMMADFADKLNDEGNRTLGVIMNNAQRMGQLIDDLLNLSRLGRQDIRLNKINIDNMVRSIVDEQIQLNNKQYKITYQQLLPANCDNGLIRQVWFNLISNAIKYSGKQAHPQITVGCYEKANCITYYVKDNGIGFDMKYAGKLFGVFQRLHKITEFEGTGVGLALVQRIISKHGGKVWAHADINKGATFYFSLPAA